MPGLQSSNIIPYTLEGTSAERSAENGGRITVGYLIKGINSTGYTGKDRHIMCLFDVLIPVPGLSLFPAVGNVPNLICKSTRIEALNSDQARLFVEYGAPDDSGFDAPVQNDVVQTEFERDFAIFRTSTNYNADGSKILVPYTVFSPTPPGTPAPPTTTKYVLGTVDDDEIIEVIRFRRREDKSGPAWTSSDVYIGHVNPVSATPFTIAGVTYPARTWLCRNINMTYTRLANNVVVFDCVYEFAHRSRIVQLNGALPSALIPLAGRTLVVNGITYIDIGWDETVYAKDSEGEYLGAGVLGDGMTLATPKPSADFVGLNLIVP